MNKPNIFQRFFLGIPPSILGRAFYGWILIIAFLPWSPAFSTVVAILLAISLLIMRYQRAYWQKQIMDDRMKTGPVLYSDTPRPALRYLLINLVIVVMLGVLFGYFLQGLAAWSALQWFLMTAGFFLFEQAFILFWLPDKYLVTNQGIWVLQDSDRIFVNYKEVLQAQLLMNFRLPIGTRRMLFPIRHPAALQILPKNPAGFTWYARQLTLTPSNAGAFLNHVASKMPIQHPDEEQTRSFRV